MTKFVKTKKPRNIIGMSPVRDSGHEIKNLVLIIY